MFKKILKNPKAYARRVPLSLAGLFHDCFIQRHNAIECQFIMPRQHTSLYERGTAWLQGYEIPECSLVREFMPPNSTVLELGACIGVVSCVLNKKLQLPERHVAVEGNPHIINSLAYNRDLNDCRFQIENCVVSHRPVEDFYLGTSIVLSGKDHAAGVPTKIVGRSINDLESKYGFKFDFLVMDIEGGEFDILTNQKEFIARCRGIVVENHPHVIGKEKIEHYETGLREMGFTKIKSIANVDYFCKKLEIAC
jgi:FkbM family methyltransferase